MAKKSKARKGLASLRVETFKTKRGEHSEDGRPRAMLEVSIDGKIGDLIDWIKDLGDGVDDAPEPDAPADDGGEGEKPKGLGKVWGKVANAASEAGEVHGGDHGRVE